MDTLGELYEIARCHGGLVTTAQAKAVGVAHQRLTEYARDGEIARIAKGVYAFGSRDLPRADARAITTAHRVTLSHTSAAAWYDAELPEPPDVLHVTAPRNRGRRKDAIPGVELHRAALSAAEVVVVRGVPVTTALRTALDVARLFPLGSAVASVDSFIRAGLVTEDEFALAAERWQGPGGKHLRLVAQLVDPNSGSILESLTRILMWESDVPTPKSQYPFSHPRLGYIGRFDFGWPELRAILECDGYEYHAARGPFQKDRRRWTAVGTSGWHLAVVTWFDVTREPDYVIAAVRELLAHG